MADDLSGLNLPQLPDMGGLSGLPDFSSLTGDYVPKKRPYEKPPKIEKPEKKAEPFGFITNLPKSVLNVAKSIFVDLPVAVGSTASHYARNPDDYGKDLDLFLNHPGETGNFLRKEVTL